MDKSKSNKSVFRRRDFLSKVTFTSAIGFLVTSGMKKVSSGVPGNPSAAMPSITLGPHRISRLICGSNPFLGYSYLGQHTDRQMKDYYTSERVVELLLRCEESGISARQSSSRIILK